MKKLFLGLVSVVLILTMTIGVASAACIHSLVFDHFVKNKYIDQGAIGHDKWVVNAYRCTICGTTHDVSSRDGLYAHTLKRTDLGHISGQKNHKYKDSCATCGYSTTVTITCTKLCPTSQQLPGGGNSE